MILEFNQHFNLTATIRLFIALPILKIEYPLPYGSLVWDYKSRSSKNIRSFEIGNWEAISVDKYLWQVNLSNKILKTVFSNPIANKNGTCNDKDLPCMIKIVESQRNRKQKETGAL